jgi:hypothetical protein
MYTRPLLLHAGPSSLVGTRPVCRAHRPRRRQRQPRAHHQLIHAIRQTNLTILLVLQMSLRLIPANLAYTRRSHHEISSWHLYPSASRSLSANQPWRSTRSRKKRRVAQMNMNPLLYFFEKKRKIRASQQIFFAARSRKCSPGIIREPISRGGLVDRLLD